MKKLLTLLLILYVSVLTSFSKNYSTNCVSQEVTVELTTCDPDEVGVSIETYVSQDYCDSIVTIITNLSSTPVVTCPGDSVTCSFFEELFLEDFAVFPAVVGINSSFSGPGVEAFDAENGLWDFYASIAGVGTHEITYTYTNESGCSNSCTFNIVVETEKETEIYLTTCDPSEEGSEILFLFTNSGCDSIVTIITDLLPSTETTVNATACDASEAGTTVEILTGANGCDSVVTTITTLLPSSEVTVNATTCDESEVGTTVEVLIGENGCDSIVTIITTLSSGPIVTCPGDSIVCNFFEELFLEDFAVFPAVVGINSSFSGPGVEAFDAENGLWDFYASIAGVGTHEITYTYTNESGCSNSCTFNIVVETEKEAEVYLTTCDPSEEGSEILFLFTNSGCDSIVTIFTDLLPSSETTVNATTCDASEVGTTVEILTGANGCDSVVTTITTLLPSSEVTVNATTCDESEVGTTVEVLIAENGCDSIVTIITTLSSGPIVTCPGDSIVCNFFEELFLEDFAVFPAVVGINSSFSGPGVEEFDAENGLWDFYASIAGIGTHEITYTYTDESGCSNSCTFNIIVETEKETEIYLTTCDPSEEGSEILFLFTNSGCDSIVTIFTDLLPSSETTVNATTCDASEAGTTVEILTGANGCDSVVTTITTLLPSSEVTINATTCDASEAGTGVEILTGANGCDSVVTTITTLLPSSEVTINATTCDASEAGTTVEILTGANGCDSVVTTITTLLPSSEVTINATTCDASEEGTTVEILTGANGCDSVVTINTTLLPSFNITVNVVTTNPAEAGVVVNNYFTVGGCDSIVTVITTFNSNGQAYANLIYFTEFILEADQYWTFQADANYSVQTMLNPKPKKEDNPAKTNVIFSALVKKKVGVGNADLHIDLQSGVLGRDVMLEYEWSEYEKRAKLKKGEIDPIGIYYVDVNTGVETFMTDYKEEKSLKMGQFNMTQWATTKGITLSDKAVIRFVYQGKAVYDSKKYESGGLHLESVHVYPKSNAAARTGNPEIVEENQESESPEARRSFDADLESPLFENVKFDVTVYPNPIVMGQRFNIELPSVTEKEVYIELVNIAGVRIENILVNTSDLFRQTISFNTDKVGVSGTYFLNVVSGDHRVTKKIQILR
jgi:hypothetical protein